MCFSKGHEELQSIAVQIIGDILSAHPSLVVVPAERLSDDASTTEFHQLHKPILKLFSKAIKSPSATTQATACTALCRLSLSAPSFQRSGNVSVLDNDELLKILTIAYFDPETIGNAALRQSLSYFLPVYCHSRAMNMAKMGRIAPSILHWCLSIKEELEVEAEDSASNEMVGLSVVVAHLVDWTDGRRLAAALGGLGSEDLSEANSDVHLELGRGDFAENAWRMLK